MIADTKVGQTVKQGNLSATVTSVDANYTTIRLTDGSTRKVPNYLFQQSPPELYSPRQAWFADVPKAVDTKAAVTQAAPAPAKSSKK